MIEDDSQFVEQVLELSRASKEYFQHCCHVGLDPLYQEFGGGMDKASAGVVIFTSGIQSVLMNAIMAMQYREFPGKKPPAWTEPMFNEALEELQALLKKYARQIKAKADETRAAN